MRAKYTGTCPICMLAIIVGHTIRKHEGRWVHLRCYRPWPAAGTEEFNRQWTEMKHQFAQREQEQERAAYMSEMEEENALIERQERLRP